MRCFLFLPMFLFVGCAMTTATSERVYTQANFDYLEWHGGKNPSLKMWKVNHSTPTRAGGSVIGTAATGATSLATALITKGLIR